MYQKFTWIVFIRSNAQARVSPVQAINRSKENRTLVPAPDMPGSSTCLPSERKAHLVICTCTIAPEASRKEWRDLGAN